MPQQKNKMKLGPNPEFPKKGEYFGVPFKNPSIKRFEMMRKKMQSKKIKDVEEYNPRTKKSKMIYKPKKN